MSRSFQSLIPTLIKQFLKKPKFNWLFRDFFSVGSTANPRAAVPGPGNSTFVDPTSVFTIDGGLRQTVPHTMSPLGWSTGFDHAPQPGLVSSMEVVRWGMFGGASSNSPVIGAFSLPLGSGPSQFSLSRFVMSDNVCWSIRKQSPSQIILFLDQSVNDRRYALVQAHDLNTTYFFIDGVLAWVNSYIDASNPRWGFVQLVSGLHPLTCFAATQAQVDHALDTSDYFLGASHTSVPSGFSAVFFQDMLCELRFDLPSTPMPLQNAVRFFYRYDGVRGYVVEINRNAANTDWDVILYVLTDLGTLVVQTNNSVGGIDRILIACDGFRHALYWSVDAFSYVSASSRVETMHLMDSGAPSGVMLELNGAVCHAVRAYPRRSSRYKLFEPMYRVSPHERRAVFLFRDTYTSGAPSPIRNADQGVCEIFDSASVFSISGVLQINGIPAINSGVQVVNASGGYYLFRRTSARLFRVTVPGWTRITISDQARFGWSPASLASSSFYGFLFQSSFEIAIFSGLYMVMRHIPVAIDDDVTFYLLLTSSYIDYFMSRNDEPPVLLFRDTSSSSAAFGAKLWFGNAPAQFTIDNFEVVDLYGTPFSRDGFYDLFDYFVAPTTLLEGAAEFHLMISFLLPTVTSPSQTVLRIRFRILDADNYFVAMIVRNSVNTNWDIVVDSYHSGVPVRQINILNVGSITRIGITVFNHRFYIFTATAASDFTYRGFFTTHYLDSQTGIQIHYVPLVTIGFVRCLPVRHALYNLLRTV